ncbi:hypothetical protein H6P81_010188 [Aristolochia fimbriata]|uniref:Uncharacterized protein n=1 Tax=Aristolochia fimbriata TaxID=158543 RepID=A0AAV7ENA9_ARIFI|nr:hypothetical protein H6P81_010188 [Aristolochia fimbriata]
MNGCVQSLAVFRGKGAKIGEKGIFDFFGRISSRRVVGDFLCRTTTIPDKLGFRINRQRTRCPLIGVIYI